MKKAIMIRTKNFWSVNDMQLIILGMDGGYPAPGGATSGYLVHQDSTAVAFDLGSGTLGRLTALMPPEDLTALVLSHWHYDHTSDVLPLLYRLMGGKPLHVYGPVDESSAVRRVLMADPAVVLHDVAPGDVLTLGDLTVTAYAARHPVPGLMYRIVGGGRTLCYTGDTNTCPGLTDFARDADLLLADGVFSEAAWTEDKPHLSAALAARLSVDANARRCIITHLNPAIDPVTLLREARAVRIDAELARPGMRCDL